MASDPMSSTKAVRRQDLFRDAAARDDNGAPSKNGQDEAAAAAAAQAELDAYMKSMLGLQFAIPEPQPKAKQQSISTPTAASKPSSTKDAKGDVDMDASDDDDDDDDTEPAAVQRPTEPAATAFAFRLFAGSGQAAGTTTADAHGAVPQPAAPVVLLDDSADGTAVGAGAIVQPRPPRHYLVGALSDAARARYAEAAVSGDAIRAQANPAIRNTWGLEVPWRARTVLQARPAQLRALLANALAPGQPAPANLPAALAAAINSLPAWAGGSPPQGLPARRAAGPRTRPGKKQRILLRRRDKVRRAAEAAEAAKAQSKEEQIAEKKKRLNRLKKLRRREKAKSAKAGGSEAGGADSGNDSGHE